MYRSRDDGATRLSNTRLRLTGVRLAAGQARRDFRIEATHDALRQLVMHRQLRDGAQKPSRRLSVLRGRERAAGPRRGVRPAQPCDAPAAPARAASRRGTTSACNAPLPYQTLTPARPGLAS